MLPGRRHRAGPACRPHIRILCPAMPACRPRPPSHSNAVQRRASPPTLAVVARDVGRAPPGTCKTGKVILRPLLAAGMAGRTTGLRRLAKVDERQAAQGEGGSGLDHPVPRDPERGLPLLRIRHQCYDRTDLIVGDDTAEGVDAIISENLAADRIRACGLRPPDRILLCGPPGTGKTLTAQIVSSALGCPFAYVAFDSLISSYLGETASNMRKVFDYMEKQRLVVLFDEFDSIGKRRDDPHEHGELKRVVNNFMQMLDEYEGSAVIMAATNHHRILDEAVWRRFDATLYFDLPDQACRALLFEKYLRALKRHNDIDVRSLATAARGYSAADIMQVCVAALRKSIVRGEDTVSKDDVARSIAEQKRQRRMRGA